MHLAAAENDAGNGASLAVVAHLISVYMVCCRDGHIADGTDQRSWWHCQCAPPQGCSAFVTFSCARVSPPMCVQSHYLPLHYAAAAGSIEVVRTIVEANPNDLDVRTKVSYAA